MAEKASNVQDVVVQCQPEFQEYTYNQSQEVTAVVTLKAPLLDDDEEGNDEDRAPIDLVAVIDKSGSMSGAKLDLVKVTLEFIISQMRSKDRLSLVTYDTDVTLDFGFKIMNKDNKADCVAKVKKICAGSMTNLSGGLLHGLCEVVDRKNEEKNDVASVLLLTDGLANQGITAAKGIVAAMKNPKRMAGPIESGPQRKKKGKSGSAKSGSADATEKSGSADATVYTFGFGSDHDPQLLKAISDAGNGMYYFIEKEEQIAESFGHCLGGLLSTVAQGIQMEMTFKDGVKVKKIHTARPKQESDDKKSVKIDMGDLQSEETRDIVLELTVDPVAVPQQTEAQNLMNVTVDYYNVITSQLATAHGNLGIIRPEKVERKKEDININVVKQRTRVQLANDMEIAEEQAKQGNYSRAQEIIKSRKVAIEQEELMYRDELGDAYEGVKEDLDVMNDAYNPHEYNLVGKYKNCNLQQMHMQQRSSAPDSKSYATKKKMAMKSKATGYASK